MGAVTVAVIGDIQEIEIIAAGKSVRDISRLRKMYGPGRWRKLKGISCVRLRSRRIRLIVGSSKQMQGKPNKHAVPRFVVCIDNSSYESSLELHKIYSIIPDTDAVQEGDLRILDESGEDYLYAADRFLAIAVPKALERAMLKKAS